MKTLDMVTAKEQEGLLKAIENTDICMFWYYPKEKLIQVNDKTAEMYHCRTEYTDMPKSFADDFVHPSTQDAFFEMYRRIDDGEKTAHASFSSIDRKNWCTVTLTVVSEDEQGRPERVCGIVQNISEMKLHEMEYHSNRRMLSDIIGALSKIYIFNYYIDLRTGEFLEIAGMDYITEVLGKKGDAKGAFRYFADALIEDNYKDSFRQFTDLDTLADRIGTRQNIALEFCSIRQGWCRSSFIVVNRDKAGMPVQAEFVVENISAERKKDLEAREALEKAYEAANRANVSKSLFLNNMSHDIRTPMNAIVGFASIAAARIDDRERVQDCIAKITASSKYLLSIINEVLDMSRIESGKLHIQEQETNLSAVLHDFADMIREQIQNKGLKFFVDSADLIHENVYADPTKLQRVLLNLAGNAVKFTPAGGMISVRLAEKPQASEGCGNYVITVRDTGIGISKEFLPHVFEPFEREQTSTISKTDGTGLGMPITKNIVELMGGTIHVESEKEHGTVFIIELPLRLAEHDPEESGPECPDNTQAAEADENCSVLDGAAKILGKISKDPECTKRDHLFGKQVLLVEDNELNREIAVELLTEEGLIVDTAENGLAAMTRIASAKDGAYDIILMDIQMPVMDGYEAAKAIRAMESEWTKKLPIFAMTANAFEEDKEKALAAGMNGHLTKPIDIDRLFQTLEEVLR